MDICVKIIPNEKHRAGVGGADWYFDKKGNLQVRVTKLSSWKREITLALHEVIEAVLAKAHGVTVAQVDAFDMDYEKAHMEDHGLNAGDDPRAPYVREHNAATACERVIAMELDIGAWSDYDREIGSIPSMPKRK